MGVKVLVVSHKDSVNTLKELRFINCPFPGLSSLICLK
ncbi:hypothetical protein [Morganella morganii IS15]|nr:hypothetical protein CSB69_1574 [Morganella morganii]CDK65717.1 hypothetical protein [Morganella morganii IS15]